MAKIEIKRAIVSVHNKSYLNLLAEYFINYEIEVLSTGGTAKFLKEYNQRIKIIEISDFSQSKEILDGRVKSLHPMIHSGILAKRGNTSHKNQLKELNVPYVDLVVVNLYPFEEISQNVNSLESECIENIDIGGPTLIRGAAKNHNYVTTLTDPNQYKDFIKEVKKNNNQMSSEFKLKYAKIAFENTAYYEAKISNWFNRDEQNFCINKMSIPVKKISKLRYGENPHQKAAVFKFSSKTNKQISGKELSYNNICDIEVASEIANQFSQPSCVILKHGNPCGVALDSSQEKAYSKALKCDKISAFGGIVAFNKTLKKETAIKINKLFTEVVIAPEFSAESKKLLTLKSSLILIKYKPSNNKTSINIKTTENFLLIQNKDNKIIQKKDLEVKTNMKPKNKSLDDMIFAFIISKYVNSNAIVIVHNLATVGIGVGQTNRLESAQQAIKKMKQNFFKKTAVLASDGFFPFPDIVELCSKNDIIGIIQPGGSKNDSEVINLANKKKIPIVFTKIRHFKH